MLLALLGALAALTLRAAEEVGELVVAVPLGVLDVGLEAQRVVQALLHEPDDVVVLVLGAGYLAGLLGSGSHWSLPLVGCRSEDVLPSFAGLTPRFAATIRFVPDRLYFTESDEANQLIA